MGCEPPKTQMKRRTSKAKLAVLEGAGHTPQAERPEEFNRVLEHFLSS